MRYTLGELLGTGSVGQVYAAEDAVGPVAVKVLHASLADDPSMVARFAAEAQATARVTHRNVVRVLEHGIEDGVPYLVMKRVLGISLRTLVHRQGPLAMPRIAHIAMQLLAAVGAIHQAGLVHGDLKSGNVLVDPANGDRVTVVDLGLARPPGAPPPGLGAQLMTGTPEYMAPELLDEEPISVAAEIYAVGAIIYEMMTGVTPYGTGSITEIVERHLADAIVAPSQRRHDGKVPGPLEHLVLRALAKDPTRRHLNADMFATALERASQATLEEDRPTRTWQRRKTAPPAPMARQLLVARHLVEARRSHAAKIIVTPRAVVRGSRG